MTIRKCCVCAEQMRNRAKLRHALNGKREEDHLQLKSENVGGKASVTLPFVFDHAERDKRRKHRKRSEQRWVKKCLLIKIV